MKIQQRNHVTALTRFSPAVIMALVISVTFAISGVSFGADIASYPSRAIEIVVPLNPGAASDLSARIAADYLSKKWKKPVSVVNKPGGSTIVGVSAVMEAKPDGYTILLDPTPATAILAVQTKSPYKLEDPTRLGLLVTSPLVFCVPANSPWKSLPQILEALKKDPKSFKSGVGGAGAPAVFGLAKLFDAAGVDNNSVGKVIFDGGAPTLAALAGGHVSFASQPLGDSIALINGGKIRPLAVSSSKRMSQVPDVPTGLELGYPQYDVSTWQGFAGPPNLPDHVVRVWAEGLKEVANDPESIKRFEKIISVIDYKNPAEYKKYCEEQYKMMREIAERFGFRK